MSSGVPSLGGHLAVLAGKSSYDQLGIIGSVIGVFLEFKIAIAITIIESCS